MQEEDIRQQYNDTKIIIDEDEVEVETNGEFPQFKSFSSFNLNEQRQLIDIVIENLAVTVQPKAACKKPEKIKILKGVTAR